MNAPNVFLLRTDAITRSRRAFYRGLLLGVWLGIAISAAVLFGGAFYAAMP